MPDDDEVCVYCDRAFAGGLCGCNDGAADRGETRPTCHGCGQCADCIDLSIEAAEDAELDDLARRVVALSDERQAELERRVVALTEGPTRG